jgi:hypothetical protein
VPSQTEYIRDFPELNGVTVEGDFTCTGKNFENFGGRFPAKVTGTVDVSGNSRLEVLTGLASEIGGDLLANDCLINYFKCPNTVIKGDLVLYGNSLRTCEGAPKVGGSIDLNNNILFSVKGIQTVINGDFLVDDCQLNTLDGFPTEVKGDVDVSNNQLADFSAESNIKVEGSFHKFKNPGFMPTKPSLEYVLDVETPAAQ